MLEIASSDYLTSPHFLPRGRAAVLWAEHVGRNTARDRDDVFEEVKRHFNDAEFVELTGVCGLFAQSNRFQDSMCLPIEEQSEVDKIRASVRIDPNRLKAYLERLVEYWPREFPSSPDSRTVEPGSGAGNPGPAAAAPQRAPRVPLLDPKNAPADSARFIEAARQLLGGVPNAVRVWAHIPNLAKLFFPFFVAFERDGVGSALPATLRFMVFLKTHHVHAASYLLAHHTVLGRAAGLTEEQLASLATRDYANSPHFSPRERAAIAWAEQVAPNTAKRNQPVFDELKKHFNNAEVVELTGLCAISSNADLIYNALRVPLESPAGIEALNGSVRIDPERLKTYIKTLLADWPREFPVPDAAAA